MREILVKVYKFDELGDETQRRVIKWFQNYIDEWNLEWDFEFDDILNEFLRVFPIKVIDYDIEYLNTARIISTADSEINLLHGVRLVKWLWNNAERTFSKPKYLGYKNKCIYSKVVFERRANLTGYYADDFIMAPILEFLSSREKISDKSITLFSLMRACINSWLKGYQELYYKILSEEYIIQFIEENGYEFYKNGKLFNTNKGYESRKILYS